MKFGIYFFLISCLFVRTCISMSQQVTEANFNKRLSADFHRNDFTSLCKQIETIYEVERRKHFVNLPFSKKKETALHLAAAAGNFEAVSKLIRLGALVEPRDTSNATPLHRAAQHGHVTCIDVLIQNGAKVDAASDFGLTPLHLAASNNRINAINALITQHHAQIDSPAESGETPLHGAALCGHTAAIKALIQHGADVNRQNNYGSTPLHLAASKDPEFAQKNHVEALKALTTAGANVELLTKKGETALEINKTPLEIAIIKGANYDEIKALLDAKAKIRISTIDEQRGVSLTKNQEILDLLKSTLSARQEFSSRTRKVCFGCGERLINNEYDVNSVEFDNLVETVQQALMHKTCYQNLYIRLRAWVCIWAGKC